MVKYKVLVSENANNEQIIFQMKTGSNIDRYSGYLMKEEDDG